MIKGSVLEFHKTFSAETGYVAKICNWRSRKPRAPKMNCQRLAEYRPEKPAER